MKKLTFHKLDELQSSQVGIYVINLSIICVRDQPSWNWLHWFGIQC